MVWMKNQGPAIATAPCHRPAQPSSVVVVPKQYIAWIGVRFRTRDDELDPTDDLGGN